MMLALPSYAPAMSMMDHMLLDTLRSPLSLPFAHAAPPTLVAQDDGSLALALSVPGVRRGDLKVTVRNGKLEVDGETKTTHGNHSVCWSGTIPRGADAENATAMLVDGILIVRVPLRAVEQTKIEVKTEDSEDAAAPEGDAP